MNEPDEMISNSLSSLYNTVSKIPQEQCIESNKSHAYQKVQQILNQLEQSKIIEVQDYHSESIQQQELNKSKVNQVNSQEKTNQKCEPKSDKKFVLKPSMSKIKLKSMSIQYMDSLFKQLKCPRHWQINQEYNHQQLFICLQNLCDCDILPSEPKINPLLSLNPKFSKQPKYIKSPISSINGKTGCQKQDGKQINIPKEIEAEIEMEMVRTQSLKKLESKILCQECLNEKLHRGHQICTLKKFQSLVCQYHWTSIQATKDLLSKIIQLKTNLDFYFNMLSNKAIEIMTLGMINDWQNYRNNFYKYNLSKNLSSKLLHKNKEFEPQISSQTILNKSPFSNKEPSCQNINIENSLNIHQLFSLNALEIWEQLLSTSKAEQKESRLTKILKFKEENILQQIEYIDNNFKEVINNCITNLQFVNNYKDWIFNPDDMCQGQIGLTLDRNKIQGLKTRYTQYQQRQKMKIKQRSTMKKNNIKHTTNCKIAFTQTPLLSEYSRNFRIEKLKQQVIIGCVNTIDHSTIAQKLDYNNFQKYLYGISVNSEGYITVYNKGQKPYTIQFAKLSQRDVVQVTLHTKNSTITFIKYSQANEEVEQSSTIKNTMKMEFMSAGGRMRNRTVIATLPIQLIDTNSAYYLLAGVANQGDCVSLAESTLIESKLSSPTKKVMKESQKTMKNNKESVLEHEVENEHFNKGGKSQKIDKSLS